MSVVIAYENTGPCRKQLTIEVPAPAVDAELSRVERDLAQRVRIPGFRPGKIPRGLIRQRFRDEIDREVSERLVTRYWRQAQAEKSLEPLTPPAITDLKLEAGEAMTFVAEVEVRPEVTLDLEPTFELPSETIEPTEAEVDDTLENLRRQHATWRETERPAAVGDRVVGEIRRLPADEDTEEAPPMPLEIELGGEGVPEELTLTLTGVTPGVSTEFERKTEDDGEQRFSIRVDAVQERELPEVDDAFAKRVGELDDVAALREAIVAQLREHKRRELDEKRRRALLEQLRQRHPMELPRRLVDHEVERMLTDLTRHLSADGVDVEAPDFDWQQLGEQVRPQAETRVHDRLLLDAIAEERDTRVDEQAFEALLRSIAAQQQKSTLALRQELSESGGLEQLRAQLRRDQTLRSLLVADETHEADDESNDREDENPEAG